MPKIRYFNAEKESARIFPQASGIRIYFDAAVGEVGTSNDFAPSDFGPNILHCALLKGLADHFRNSWAQNGSDAPASVQALFDSMKQHDRWAEAHVGSTKAFPALAEALHRFRTRNAGKDTTLEECAAEVATWTKDTRETKLKGNDRFAATYAQVKAERLSAKAGALASQDRPTAGTLDDASV